jgi:hypothetical protein
MPPMATARSSYVIWNRPSLSSPSTTTLLVTSVTPPAEPVARTSITYAPFGIVVGSIVTSTTSPEPDAICVAVGSPARR